MKTTELSREIELAANDVRSCHLNRLQALGVTSATIAKLGAKQPPFGVMKCENLGNGIFQPGGDSPYLVQPVYDGGILIDIVAWRTVEPRNWLWRTGAAWALNPGAITTNNWQDEPLAIDDTPLTWLCNGTVGICILNWSAPEIRQLLRINSINADRHIAEQLHNALEHRAYFPEIKSMKDQRDVA